MGVANWLTFGMLDRYRNWKYGGVTGLNYVSANIRMTGYVALPWLIGYIVCFIIVPDPFLEPSILFMSGIWGAYCYGLYAYAKVDASNYRCFPQAVFRFPDGGSAKYDLTLDPKGFSKEVDFDDDEGGQGWRINLGKKLQYWDKRSEFPFVFDYMLLRLPDTPDKCFEYLSEGEFFHKGVAIRFGACESISVYIFEWFQDPQGRYVPVGVINDCSLRYDNSKEKGKLDKKLENKLKRMELQFEEERSRRMTLQKHTETLEDMIESDVEDSKKFERRVEQGISRRRDLYKSIVDMGKPLIQRIKDNLWKILAIIAGIFFVLWFFKVI